MFLFIAPNDHELMTAMMNRISLLEQRVSHQNKEITDKVGLCRICRGFSVNEIYKVVDVSISVSLFRPRKETAMEIV